MRHTETLPADIFDGSVDRLEVDTGADAVTVVSEINASMNFTAGADPIDNRLLIGTSSNNGPVLNEFFFGLVTVGGETRLVLRNIFGANSAPGNAAYLTHNTAGAYFDRDFSFSAGDQTASFEDTRRGVREDWRITLNASSEYFLILYRQQDASNQSLEQFPPTTGNVMSHSPDIGLYASRLTTILDGQSPLPLSGLALVGSSAVRLDTDFSTTDPLLPNQYREDAVAFLVQREIEPLFRVQSDPDRINVLFLTIKDDNPAREDARNNDTGNHSYEIIKVVQVENGTALTLRPSQGGVEVARYPFGTLTRDNDYNTPQNPGTVAGDDFDERAFALDAGVDGDAVVYFLKPKADDVLVGTTYTAPSPLGLRLYAGNFNGTSTLTTRQVSSDAYDADLGADNHAKFQVLGVMPAMTRGIGTAAPTGRYHILLWIEDRTASASFIGGGALMTLRYNKAAPGATAARLVSANDAFTPSITASSGWPLQADFLAGDSVSFPVGFGADTASLGLYFNQFGEIYYNEYSFGSGRWWLDNAGLPAPTLVSNEGFPGMPNPFMLAVGGQDTDMYGTQVFCNYMVQEFNATLGGSSVLVRRYDNLHKGLVLYAKDDGGWDPEDDGTGFNRLFCRIRN